MSATESTDEEYRERVESLLEDLHGDRIYAVEEGHVWVSGMNASCGQVARQMAQTLVNHGIPCGLVYDDGTHAANNGGVQFNYGEAEVSG